MFNCVSPKHRTSIVDPSESIGARGFESSTFPILSERANRATLRPDCANNQAFVFVILSYVEESVKPPFLFFLALRFQLILSLSVWARAPPTAYIPTDPYSPHTASYKSADSS